MMMNMFISIIMNLFLLHLPEAGATAPDFSAVDQNGKTISLKDYKGKKVIIYFYPKNNTSGCTTQACNIRDNFSDLQKKGYVVLGISVDDEKSHQKFSKEYNLPFSIISDSKKEISKKYGVYNSVVGISNRITFLINEKGVIDHVIKNPNVKNHTQEIILLWQ